MGAKDICQYLLKVANCRSLRPLSYVYPAAGDVNTGILKIISDSRLRSIIAKGPKYIFPVQIDFQKCRQKLQVSWLS